MTRTLVAEWFKTPINLMRWLAMKSFGGGSRKSFRRWREETCHRVNWYLEMQRH